MCIVECAKNLPGHPAASYIRAALSPTVQGRSADVEWSSIYPLPHQTVSSHFHGHSTRANFVRIYRILWPLFRPLTIYCGGH